MTHELGAGALRVVLAFALALAGGAISTLMPMTHAKLCRLISFAAGTLLGVALFSIIPEGYEALPVWQLLLGLGSGYVVFWLVSHYVYHVCPACAASHFDETATHRFSEIATAMVIALGIHSTMDGLALALGKESEIPGSLTLSLFVAICIHKVPEGLALSALLLAAGFGRWKTMLWVAAVEATTILGGAIGLLAAPQIGGRWMDTLMAHIGGGFIFLAVHAVFGEVVKHSRPRVLAYFTFGLVLIGLLNAVLGV